MTASDDMLEFTGGLVARLPEPADFGIALAEGFARRIGDLARRAGAPSASARWAARAAFATSRATAGGHVCVALAALAQRYEAPLDEVRAALAASGVVAFGTLARGDERPLIVDRHDHLYLSRYFDYERRLADALVAQAGVAAPDEGLSPDRLRDSLARYFGPATGEVDWQRVAAIVALTGRVTIVSGGPGTGKTTTVVGVLACLLDAHPGLRIALAAPTGKAAQRMQEALHARAGDLPPELAARLPDTSYTLHRLLGGGGAAGFRHHRDNPLPYDLIVVDEASMIDVALAAHLLDALAPGARLVLLGDKDQLAAVEAGAVFAELSARPAFTATARTRIAQALGVDEAAFVAALPVPDEAAPAAVPVANPVPAAARAPAPPSASVPVSRRSASRSKVDTRQASLFDDEPQDDEVSSTDIAPPPPTESATLLDASASDDTPAWIEADELAWLDAVELPPFDAGDAALASVTAASPSAGEAAAAAASAIAPAAAPLADCVVWLERNYRFGLDSPIGRLSLAIRRGDVQAALDALPADDSAAASFHDDAGDTLASSTVERLARRFGAYLDALRDALAAPVPDPLPLFDALNRFRILCATRSGSRGAEHVNALVAAHVRHAARVPLAVGAHWFTGRPIMVTRNDYALGLFNGDIGIALPDAHGVLRVWFRRADGTARAVSPAALPPHETAFALTVHKSQGSEFDEAALVLPASFGRVLTRELVYTAVTRARTRVQVIGPRRVLAQAVATRTQRDSGLAARVDEALARRRTEASR
ncbi:AAA family ATPase [Burkholderia cenocepacia]|uniref:RecBCD enzyme subunit RecD n=1 Tax=Burkholderia cenocepacia (strain ATCC BAA-245 / DSM 16553 / LMG 16656 / NCTC 13227 / J2315 / CF5610) TaxID=216591 RepID=B4ED34_BURCJ|nr:AAA family ATPase [Burkholderia cenocepacia]KIS48005.1 exodeoxyribonuclease V, alpha subunit [Burkholderia cepacia]EPZ85565.1 putative exodeoxyribonuclease V alpha chain [Burkholderia cenocepacia K56-2Valvano]ERI25335.1 putative exodeoxyribonuclease V alpha chain [Burkholderia cenocepacia BC7]KKI79649.1 exodeoxyribonuclease V subunit alpha [Burkholderia cenocepacia]MEB2498735.1 AAA family ATPase [Burkholderia cenocepacia]